MLSRNGKGDVDAFAERLLGVDAARWMSICFSVD